jgi:hypothetical protein
VEEYLVAFREMPQVSSGMRRRPSSSSESAQPENNTSSTTEIRSGAGGAQEVLFPSGAPPEGKQSSRIQPASPEAYNVRFAAGKSFKEKLTRLAEILGIERPESRLQEVLEQALDIALDRKDPQRKLERKLQKAKGGNSSVPAPACPEEVKGSSGGGSVLAPVSLSETREDSTDLEGNIAENMGFKAGSGGAKRIPESTAVPQVPPSRYIPASIRLKVFQRAGYQCEYRGLTGHRCQERTGLEIDHIRAYACGGSHDEWNLRTLCRSHNRWKAEKDFGEGFIRRKIALARNKRVQLDRHSENQEEGCQKVIATPEAAKANQKHEDRTQGASFGKCQVKIWSGRGGAPSSGAGASGRSSLGTRYTCLRSRHDSGCGRCLVAARPDPQ